MTATTINPEEVAKFSAMADEWWDPKGKFKPLHQFNPIRLGYIRDWALKQFGRDEAAEKPLAGLTVLDIGCGGGLLCEPLTRLGATVTGIDASGKNITIAGLHAEKMGLAIAYREATSEQLVAEGARFDIVLNMEVVEHVSDVDFFLTTCASMVRPGGMTFVATINRTMKAAALAIFAAENVLRWLPRGTHQWEKFVTPAELTHHLERNKLAISDQAGVVYNPLADRWSLSSDMDVNYMLVAEAAS